MTTSTPTPGFDAWLDDFFAGYYRHRPVNATFIGVHQHDGRLPDYSDSGVGDALAEAERLLARLQTLPVERLRPAQQLDRDTAAGFLEIQRWEYDSSHFRHANPSLSIAEAVFGVMSLFLRPFAPLQERIDSAVARLEAVPTLLAQAQASVRRAPGAWTERAIAECGGTLAFLAGGIDQLIAESGGEQPALRRAADRAAEAVAGYRRYLETELLRQPSDDYAAGPEALELYLRRGHFLQPSADEIERYALDQLAQSHGRLASGARELGYPDWRAALAALAERHPSAARYEDRYAEVWAEARAAAEAHGLVRWPDYPIRYVPRPLWARAAAPSLYFLFYRAPAAFDHLDVVDYLVAPLDPAWAPEETERFLRANNDSVIRLNHVVHHGGLGHHVQNWNAYNRAESRVGRIAAVDCASRIAMFCGGTMAEGWACYATELMDEIGYLSPLEHLSEVQSRARMAARAIVDVRLHTGRLTLDEAARFYQEHAGMAEVAARGEAVKNSLFPGAALMYLIGTDLIHQLRRDLAAAEGSRFNLRDFHDRFLAHGSLPVSLIARAMRGA